MFNPNSYYDLRISKGKNSYMPILARDFIDSVDYMCIKKFVKGYKNACHRFNDQRMRIFDSFFLVWVGITSYH